MSVFKKEFVIESVDRRIHHQDVRLSSIEDKSQALLLQLHDSITCHVGRKCLITCTEHIWSEDATIRRDYYLNDRHEHATLVDDCDQMLRIQPLPTSSGYNILKFEPCASTQTSWYSAGGLLVAFNGVKLPADTPLYIIIKLNVH